MMEEAEAVEIKNLREQISELKASVSELSKEITRLDKELEAVRYEALKLKNIIDVLEAKLAPLQNFYKIATAVIITGIVSAILALIFKNNS